MNSTNLAQYIDHTLLKPDANMAMIEKLCHEANEYQFYSVCLNPYYLPYAKKLLKGQVKLCTVVGFPLGAHGLNSKAIETKSAIDQGADEIDMVINIGALKDNEEQFVIDEISSVVEIAGTNIVKVIIETCLLTDDEKIKACQLIEKSGARYVKTSTGFSSAGADINDIRLFKSVLKNDTLIKASGGIKNRKQALEFIEAGASRLGTSSGIEIITG